MFTRKEESTPTSYDPPSTQVPHTNEPPRSTTRPSARENVISRGTRVKGNVFCEEDLRIEGNVTGNVYSKAKVTIGQGGLVEGRIECVRGEIHGTLKGTLTVQDTLSLKSEANIEGDVLTAHLAMEPTVRFNGNCTMKDKITLPGPQGTQSEKEEKAAPAATTNPPVSKFSNNSPLKKNVEKERFIAKSFQR